MPNHRTDHKIIVLLIILLMTLGQLSVSLYLPSMPAMADDLNTKNSSIEMTIILYVLGFGCSGFIYGPLSETYGRKKMILIGLSIFLVASLLALFSPSIQCLLVARFLQGIGMGSGDTMGRAILCDIYLGAEFVKAASYISMAAPAIPMLAPAIGGYIQTWLNWRANFAFILGYALLCLLLVIIYLPETKTYPRIKINFKAIIKQYWMIIKNPIFIGYFLPGVIAAFGDLVYSIVLPFIVQQQFGWTPIKYGWLAVFTAIGILLGAIFSHKLSHKSTTYSMVLLGLCILFLSSLLLLMTAWLNYQSLLILILAVLIFMMGTGIVFPNTNAGALTPFAYAGGIVGALQGGLQTALTGTLGIIVAEFGSQTIMSLASTLVIASCLGIIGFVALLAKR